MSDQAADARPSEAGQLGLFDDEETLIDRTFATAWRTWLDETSWVEYVPGWLAGSRSVFSTLLSNAGWQQRDRWMFDQWVVEPRLTAEYCDAATAPFVLREIASALSDHYGNCYDGLWLNLYRDHR